MNSKLVVYFIHIGNFSLMDLRVSVVNKIFLVSSYTLILSQFQIKLNIHKGCKTTKNAHGISVYSQKYTHTHELLLYWLMPVSLHMAGIGREKQEQQCGTTSLCTCGRGMERRKTGKIVQYCIFIKPKSYNFCSAAFCCFICISSLCSCSNVSSETPN